jgi:hypothetical protein
MASYTFTVSQTFSLTTHQVTFTKSRIQIKLSSSGTLVYDRDFSGGIAFRCDGTDFQIGKLNADNYLSKSVDTSIEKSALWLVENGTANKFIGTDDPSDESIYHIFRINECPVLLSRDGNKAVMKCPCEGAPCGNGCYTYGL